MSSRRKRGRRVRHYQSYYSRQQRFSSVLIGFLAAAAIFAVGFFAGPYLLDMGSHAWHSLLERLNTPASSQAPASSDSAEPTEPPEETPPPPEDDPTSTATPVAWGNWTTVSLSALSSPEAIAAAARKAGEEGAAYAIIPLKDTSGYIYYASEVPLAAGSVAATTIDAAAVARAFRAEGVIPVASLAAFRDPLTPYTDRDLGIRYTNSNYMWLDAKADAGGKPWLNPYRAEAVGYLGDLMDEVVALGYDHLLLTAVQFPSMISAKQDFGDTGGLDRPQMLAKIITGWNERFAGRATLWYCYDYAACAGPVNALGATPDALGAQHLMIQLPIAQEGEEQPDTSALPEIAASLKEGGVQHIVLRGSGSIEFFR